MSWVFDHYWEVYPAWLVASWAWLMVVVSSTGAVIALFCAVGDYRRGAQLDRGANGDPPAGRRLGESFLLVAIMFCFLGFALLLIQARPG